MPTLEHTIPCLALANSATFVCPQNETSESGKTIQYNQTNDQKTRTVLNPVEQDEFLIFLSGSSDTMHVADVYKYAENSFLDCVSSLAVPSVVQHAAGGILLDQDQSSASIIVCGGLDVESNEKEECYRLNGSGNDRNLGSMRYDRSGAASVVMDNGKTLWMTGGYDGRNSTLWSTEIVTLGSGFVSSYGPDLPIAGLRYHCLERVGPNVAILLGGERVDNSGFQVPSSRCWTVDIYSLYWTELPSLDFGRSNQACGVVKDMSVAGKKIVIVAGGKTLAESISNTVEQLVIDQQEEGILNSGSSNVWEIGPAMPVPIVDAGSATTADQGRLFVVGGETEVDRLLSSVFEIQCSFLQCLWKKSPLELKQPNSKGLALVLPSNPLELRSRAEIQCRLNDNDRGNSCSFIFLRFNQDHPYLRP